MKREKTIWVLMFRRGDEWYPSILERHYIKEAQAKFQAEYLSREFGTDYRVAEYQAVKPLSVF
jgi:hypothetical protein